MTRNLDPNDLIDRLRALSRCEHDDLSIGDEAAAEIERLRSFARDLFDSADWPDGGGIDGFSFQDLAAEHGLLIEETRHAPCNLGREDDLVCACVEYHGSDGFGGGVTCYRKVDWLERERQQ